MRKVAMTSAFLIILALILLFSVPVQVDKRVDAVEMKLDDPSYIQECNITISGLYYFNLFTNDEFAGTIAVSEYNQTSAEMSRVHISKEGFPLFYHRFEDGVYDEDGQCKKVEYCLGKLVSGCFFHNMVITVYSNNPLNKGGGWKEGGDWGGWNDRDGYCIVPNAHSYEEAVQILAKK